MSERIGVQKTGSYEDRSSEVISVTEMSEAERVAKRDWPRFHTIWKEMADSGEMPMAYYLRAKKLAGVE